MPIGFVVISGLTEEAGGLVNVEGNSWLIAFPMEESGVSDTFTLSFLDENGELLAKTEYHIN